MSLSKEEVRHVALLARLGLDDDQIERLEGELNAILDHINQISQLDLDAVESTTRSIPVVNAMREDVVRPGFDREMALLNAPDREDGAIVIPRIVGPGGGDQ